MPAEPRPPSTALLRHSPPDAAPHLDWLVVLDGTAPAADERTVPCYRLQQRLDRAGAGTRLEARRIDLHRAFYLRLDTPTELSNRRGRVEPLRQGDVLAVRFDGDDRVIDLRWRGGAAPDLDGTPVLMRIRLLEIDPERSRLEVESATRAPQDVRSDGPPPPPAFRSRP